MRQYDVIFFINPPHLDLDWMAVKLEKLTNCRVFNFFSVEESLLYKSLNPRYVVHKSRSIDPSMFGENVKFIDISRDVESVINIPTADFIHKIASQINAKIVA